MDPTAWLEKAAPGFEELATDERSAIRDFSFMWSLYEGMILNSSGSAGAIIDDVNWLRNRGSLHLGSIQASIEHFLTRYFDGADLTHSYKKLFLRQNDCPDLVERVVRRQSLDEAEILSAILIIILRLRNNLFHGVKWSYGIKGQLMNFQNANHILMAVMEMHE